MGTGPSHTILVTGGAGFIGSNFITGFLSANEEFHIVTIDKLTYAGNLENLSQLTDHPRHTFIQGDICDQDLVAGIFKKYTVSSVIHFAAESHVDRSIDNPSDFVYTNVVGTYVLLETARQAWNDAQGKHRHVFQHISTDEVYGSLGKTGQFTEQTPYAPNSPYSATKASSDLLARSYFHTYGLPVITSQCSNNYGPRQHDEKLIPTIIRNAVNGNPIPIYGDGANVRDWLYVGDHCRALSLIFQEGIAGETYLIGGGNEHNNLYIAHTLCELLDEVKPRPKGSYKEQITMVEDRPGHDFRYAVDHSKISRELGWQPEVDFKSGLKSTLNWYLKKYQGT